MKDLAQDVSAAATIRWNGTSFRTLIATEETGGTLCLLDSFSPANSGPPRHIHQAEDESFFILSGEAEFWVAGRTFRKGPGEAAFVPRGTEHTFKALTDLRKLIILTPGGFEGFFAEVARGGYRVPDDMGPIVECGARHHLTFTGPPL